MSYRLESLFMVKINSCGIEIDGVTHPLYSGDMHYWRIDRDKWPGILDSIKMMGFRFVCTYIPWGVHEVESGVFDFGHNDSRKDLSAFLALCGEKGLYVLVRPGPHINAELNWFGFPPRLFERPELLARTSQNTTALVTAPPRLFPMPSYASDDFFDEAAGWFDAVCPIIIRHLHANGGPVVAIQPDNETSFFFRTAPFDVDYSDASIALYRHYLDGKYTSVNNLNAVYGTSYGAFEEINPPRRFKATASKELPPYFDWMEFKEYSIFHAVVHLAKMLRERGIEDIPYFHNFPLVYSSTPFHIPKLESQIDIAGIDLYRTRDDYDSVKVASTFLHSASRLPFIPEFGSGCWLWWKPLFLKDQKIAARTALMHGIKAANFYMIVERDRWYGSPVTRDGRRRKGYFDFYGDLNSFIKNTKFNEYQLQSQAALLCMRDYERLEQLSSLISPVGQYEPSAGLPYEWFVSQQPLEGFRDPIAAVYKRQWRAFRKGFARAGIHLSLADSSCELTTLERYSLIIAPSFEFMTTATQKRLLVYALKGGTLVLGPRIPRFDERLNNEPRFRPHTLHPLGEIERIEAAPGFDIFDADIFNAENPILTTGRGCCAYSLNKEKGRIIHLGFIFDDYSKKECPQPVASLMRDIADIAGITPAYQPDDHEIETALHIHPVTGDAILFAANPTADEKHFTITLAQGQSLENIDDGAQSPGKISLESYSVGIFRLLSAAAPDKEAESR